MLVVLDTIVSLPGSVVAVASFEFMFGIDTDATSFTSVEVLSNPVLDRPMALAGNALSRYHGMNLRYSSGNSSGYSRTVAVATNAAAVNGAIPETRTTMKNGLAMNTRICAASGRPGTISAM